MSHRNSHHQHSPEHPRKPTAAESYVCLGLVGVLIFAAAFMGAPIQLGIVLAAVFLMSLQLGFTWQELENAICDRILCWARICAQPKMPCRRQH